MNDDRRTPERNSLQIGAEPELVVRYRDPVSEASGFVVIDTLSNGVAFGGVRISPRITWPELAPLARSTTIRYQLSRVSIGGARLGLDYDPHAADLEEVLGRFLTSLRGLLHQSLSLGPDLHVPLERLDRVLEKNNLPWRMEAVQRNQGWPVERWRFYQRLLDQREDGVLLRELQVPYSTAYAVMAMGEFLFHRQQTVGIVGTGPFGLQIARLLSRLGATVVAVGGPSAGIYCAQGIRPELLQDNRELQMSLDSGYLYITNEELYAMPLDVLVLASGANQITIDNVGKVRASLVVEAAARSVSQNAERVLAARGTPVLPNSAATLGAIVLVQAILNGETFDKEAAIAYVQQQVSTTTRELARLAATLRITLREASIRLAFHRLNSTPLEPLGGAPLEPVAEEDPPEVP